MLVERVELYMKRVHEATERTKAETGSDLFFRLQARAILGYGYGMTAFILCAVLLPFVPEVGELISIPVGFVILAVLAGVPSLSYWKLFGKREAEIEKELKTDQRAQRL